MLPHRPKVLSNNSMNQKKGQTAKPFSILSLGLLNHQNKGNHKGKNNSQKENKSHQNRVNNENENNMNFE